jgi:predicted lipoprotein with Yx(FWY)xxD motif
MKHSHTAIFSGAAAVTSFVGVGLGTAAGAAPSRATSTQAASTAPTMKTLIRLQGASKPSTLHTAKEVVNGKSETILVTAKGLPLYFYQPDLAKKSLVSGELARLWPPLLSVKPTGTGTQGKLAALKVASGHQVTYNGHFLYTFIADLPGHVTGQGESNFFVATPHIKAIAAGSNGKTSSSTSGAGYGY